MKNKIYYWSPHFVDIATPKAVVNSACSVQKYSDRYDCKVLNFYGEFNKFKRKLNRQNVKLINYFKFDILKYLPKYGKINSRLSLLIMFLIGFFPLKSLIKKEKPEFIIVHLLTSLPLFLLIFFNFKTKFILRISGLPKMNYFRTLLWKIALKKIFTVTCPTKKTCEYLKRLKIVDSKKIKLLYDPIIDIEEDKKKLFEKNNFYRDKKNFFLSVGRLTKQKNFLFLCDVFKDYIKVNPNAKLIIAGDGEEKKIIKKFIIDNLLEKNIFLIGYVKNIFPLIKKAKAFILSSLWEDPGFVIIEAAFCKTLVISSNCLNGPKELIKHKHNGILFKSNIKKSLLKQLNNFPKYIKIKKKIIKNNFKICQNFSTNNHFEKLNLILRGL